MDNSDGRASIYNLTADIETLINKAGFLNGFKITRSANILTIEAPENMPQFNPRAIRITLEKHQSMKEGTTGN